uniref:Family with sequence similarity 168 member B n=1 Tax=Taeniopygia guttata TaxID=59729 RepID=H0Z5E9_TAEGU
MNPVYSPGSSGVPYANAKGIGYPAGFPMGYAAAAPAYSPNMYPGANPTFQTGYTPGTPYKVSCSPTSGAVPPYSSSPNPYQTAVYPVRSAYPQQNPYAQQGTYYTQPLYAAPPHVIHHTTVVQPNGMPATMYPAPIPPPRGNGVTMGMVAGTTMAMSAGGCAHTRLFSVGISLVPSREHSCLTKCDATGALDRLVLMSVQKDLCKSCVFAEFTESPGWKKPLKSPSPTQPQHLNQTLAPSATSRLVFKYIQGW